MNETTQRKVGRKGIAIALGIICVVLATCLSGVTIAYTLMISEKNNTISLLQNQLNTLLNVTGASLVKVDQINLDPAKWENKTVIVAGKLTGPYAYFTSISYYYVLSSYGNATSLTDFGPNSVGVDFGDKGGVYDSANVLVAGVVRKGMIGTVVSGGQPTVTYYIEEKAVLLF